MPRDWPQLNLGLVPNLKFASVIAAIGFLLATPLISQEPASPQSAPTGTSAQQEASATKESTAVTDLDAVWQQNLADWRAAREKGISAPTGWLTLIGMDWLKPGLNSVGTAADNAIRLRAAEAPEHIGILTVIGKTVQLLAPSGGFPPDLEVDGVPAQEGRLAITNTSPSLISWHGLKIAVLARGDRFALSIKDSDAAARTSFHGLNWYPPEPKFLVEARWIPFTPPRILKIPTVLGTTIDLPSPGIAEFKLGNATLRLEPVLEEPDSQILFFLLRDATGKTTTYETARYLHTGLPDHGLDQPGTLILDFNRLENPPCAYSLYATCPLPPQQNRLWVPIEAGEKRYEH